MSQTKEVVKLVPPKKKRERITMIEVPPSPDWFVTSKTPNGKTLWYVRVQFTGMRPRRFGPFETKHKGLLFLDAAINCHADCINEMENAADEYGYQRGVHRSRWGCIMEDDLASAYLQQKGRGAC